MLCEKMGGLVGRAVSSGLECGMAAAGKALRFRRMWQGRKAPSPCTCVLLPAFSCRLTGEAEVSQALS